MDLRVFLLRPRPASNGMSTNSLLFGVIFILIATAIFFIIRIEIRLRKLFKGSKADTLESLIADIIERVETLSQQGLEHADHLAKHNDRIVRLGRGVKLIRFNPFPEVGGNQSFAVAIMNEDGDGVVFSSLYSRERMSVFAKPIIKGKSDIELTKEEQSVVLEAQKDAVQ